MTTRILLAEDVDLIAEAFTALLNTEDDFEVIRRVSRGDEVVGAIEALRPDIALLDVAMPGCTGIEATQRIRAKGLDCKVLLLTSLEGAGHLQQALQAGANGYLVKTTTADRLIDGIRSVVAGGTVIDSQLAADALRLGPNPLTERESDLLRLIELGKTTEEIAATLFLSRGTVRNYISGILEKLGSHSRSEAASLARGRGWL